MRRTILCKVTEIVHVSSDAMKTSSVRE